MRINKTRAAIVGLMLLALCACSRQQSDWQKAREANSTDSYELFIKKYPSGEFSGQAQARLKDLYEERDWQKARDADTPEAYQAFVKQYPEGKWTEEARIRVENFTLAQTPTASGPGASPAAAAAGSPSSTAGPPARGAAAASTQNPASAVQPAPASSAPAASKPAAPSAKAESAGARPPARSQASATAESGRYAVQLGAFRSGTAAADKRWARLQKQYPKLLAGLSSKVLPKKVTGGTLYRLQAVGMTESHARRICKDLKAKSQPCIVVRPARA
jgi:cell division protein FtsN